MGYILIFHDLKNQYYYCYDDDKSNLMYIAFEDEIILESFIILQGSKSELPLAGFLPYEVYLNNVEVQKNNVEVQKRRRENGLKAQELFKIIARERLFIVEDIPQDKDSIANYKVIESIPVKRADYNIKNCKNIEVEVKCLTLYPRINPLFFYISSYEVEKLENLNKLTGKKTILAIYSQAEIDQENCSVIMIKLSTIRKNKRPIIYDMDKDCYKVPISLTTEGFELLEKYRIKGDLYKKSDTR